MLDTYTIESSCWGYKVKGTGEEEGEQPQIEQFKPDHFLQFGKQLLLGMCKHLGIHLTDRDMAQMHTGFDIELDYCLGMEDVQKESSSSKPPAKKKKKV